MDFGDELRAFAEILDEEVIATVIAMSRRRELLVMMSIDVTMVDGLAGVEEVDGHVHCDRRWCWWTDGTYGRYRIPKKK